MKYLLSISIIFISYFTTAQQSYFYKIDSENGFQSNEVYEVEQDSFGFIWIGCDAGIFRFDGVNFKQYIHPKQNGRSISHLIIDDKQRVWCQNFSGQIFYIYQDSIHLFKDFSKENASFPCYTIFNNQLITALKDSTRIYDIATKTITRQFQNKLKSEGITYVPFHFRANKKGIYATDRINIFFTQKDSLPELVYFPEEYFCSRIDIIKDKTYALLLEERTQKWSLVTLKGEKIILQKKFPADYFSIDVYMIAKIKDGFAVCTSKGVHLFDDQFNRVHHYFPDEKITDALYDKEGNLWLTSLQNGIFVIPSIDLKIYKNDFFPFTNFTTLAKKNNQLIIGTYSGILYNFNPATERYEELHIGRKSRFNRSKRIIENERYQVFALGEKTILIDKKMHHQKIISPANVRDMVILKDSIYAVTNQEFCVADLKGNRYRNILKRGGNVIVKSPNSDTIYVADKNGFYHYINGKVTEIKKNGQIVFPICADWQGDTLWLGTANNGFIAYKNGRFINHFYKNNGGYGNMVRSIRIYKNWLFAAMDIGLIRMNLQTQKMETINTSDGLHQKEIMRIEVIDDDVFLATTKGLIRFPIHLKAQNLIIPTIALNSIFVNDSIQVRLGKRFFKHTQNNILFQFETALFRSRKTFQYEYRLKGLSDRWQKAKATEAFAQYRSLPAGVYIFEVRALNEDDVKSRIEQYQFTVFAPIWQRSWFLMLLLLTLGFITFYFVNRRINNIKRQARIKNELKTSQLTALKAQMNPHFLYNALNSIQDLILQKDVKNASRYLTKFSHLMRQVLDASGTKSIILSDEIKVLTLYLDLEKLRFGDDFRYEIQIAPNIDSEFSHIPPMIIQPFVENAVKHGLLHKTKGIKLLQLHFEQHDLLVCTITDNGIGRTKSTQIQERQGKKRTSFATSATQKRLDILNETYQQKIGLEIVDLVENELAIGTKVILHIPFINHS